MTIRGWSALRLVCTLCLVAAAAAACTSSSKSASPAASGTAALSPSATVNMESSCSFKLTKGDLPVWAREGFRPPFNATPFVTSNHGDLIGVVFGYPLKSPRVKPNDGNNKILWVSQEHAGQMEVYAQLVGSSQAVDIGFVDVGPSIIDMPKPGCWHLALKGFGWTDTIDLVYNED
jgi:hypothetical protein